MLCCPKEGKCRLCGKQNLLAQSFDCGPQLGCKLQVGGKPPVPCPLLHRREESIRKACTTTLNVNLQSTTLLITSQQ